MLDTRGGVRMRFKLEYSLRSLTVLRVLRKNENKEIHFH